MRIDNGDIFEQIGNVFYAVAMDQKIHPIEFAQLKQLISKNWLPRNAEAGANEPHLILVTMDSLNAAGVSSRDAYRDFSRFYNLHEAVFTNDLKQRVLDSSIEITHFFREKKDFKNRSLEEMKKMFQVESRNQSALPV